MSYMKSAVVAGLTIEGPYLDGDYALYIGNEIIFLTPKQMINLAENLIDRVPYVYEQEGTVFAVD